VRPIFTTSSKAFDFSASTSRSARTAGITRLRTASVHASAIAAGNTSFDDWPRFTWSFG
jgi:hypothetical protein